MNKIAVQSRRGRYQVLVGENLLANTGRLVKSVADFRGPAACMPRKVMIVTQRKIAGHYLSLISGSLRKEGFEASVHEIPDGEKAKSGDELFRLLNQLVRHDFERCDLVLALGGGVVGDLAGFAASVYLRGVPFVNVATTLLAQVDSAIGGKTGINLAAGKNLAGVFYPPKLVISDTGTLTTLPDREFCASLAEVVKYGVIRDSRLFHVLECKQKNIFGRDRKILIPIIATCARIKAGVVSRDEEEITGERMILNYGHTFAHAVEKELAYRKIVHGEAVALGMVCAARLAVMLEMFPSREEERQRQLISGLKLPISLRPYRLSVRDLMQAMMRDKKKRSGDLKFVLPTAIGHVSVMGGIAPVLVEKALIEIGAIA